MEVVARGASQRGEMVLSRRGDGEVELRVNGVFVMDSVETASEQLLAAAALAAVSGSGRPTPLRVLVGGLGLGYTLAAVLSHPEVASVVVAEIEPDLVSWHQGGIVPAPAGVAVLADPRVEVRADDVRDVVVGEAGDYDLILLDVDNGPDYLIYEANAEIYSIEFLNRCKCLVSSRHGVVAVWSAHSSAALRDAMGRVFASSSQRLVPVVLGRRETTYHLFLGSNDSTNAGA